MNKSISNIFLKDLSYTYALESISELTVVFKETATLRIYMLIIGWTPSLVVFFLAPQDESLPAYTTLIIVFGLFFTLLALVRGKFIFDNKNKRAIIKTGLRKILGTKTISYEDIVNVVIRTHMYSPYFRNVALYYYSVHLALRNMDEIHLFKGDTEDIVNNYVLSIIKNNGLSVSHETSGA